MLKIKKNTLARLTLFMLMLCMTFTITSCSEDEESNVQVSKDIVDWTMDFGKGCCNREWRK